MRTYVLFTPKLAKKMNRNVFFGVRELSPEVTTIVVHISFAVVVVVVVVTVDGYFRVQSEFLSSSVMHTSKRP